MSSPLRCAVIGAGTMGAMYATALAQVEGTELVAIVDLDAQRAEAVAQGHPGAAVLTSTAQLLELDVDAAAVALPDFAHRDTAVALLDAGAHVLCEKPLATSQEDCLAIAAAEARSSASLMVNFGNRHKPAARMLRQRIAQGDLGDVQSIVFKGHERWVKTMSLAWRGRTDPTWFLISHLVDLLTWLTDERVVSVFGRGAHGAPAGLTEVTGPNAVSYLVDLQGGAHATLTSSWALPEGFAPGGDFSIEVIGTEGMARVNFGEGGTWIYDRATTAPGWDFDVADFDGRMSGWWFTACRYFVTSVRAQEQPHPSSLDGLRTSAVLAAMSESLTTGAVVAVPDWEQELA